MMSVREAAKAAGVSWRTLYRAVLSGSLSAMVDHGGAGHIRVSQDALDAWIAARKSMVAYVPPQKKSAEEALDGAKIVADRMSAYGLIHISEPAKLQGNAKTAEELGRIIKESGATVELWETERRKP